MPSATASGSDAKGNGARSRENQGNQGPKFTPEQKKAIDRIRKCNPKALYKILACESKASDNDIKKAYRSLSLLTHPDKTGWDGADEAFKMLSHANNILSDPKKREMYDLDGGDASTRFNPGSGASAGGGSPFGGAGGFGGGGFPRGRGNGGISVEDLFDQFFNGPQFGGAQPGAQFGFGGPQFSFGGPNIRVHHFGGAGPQRRPRPTNSGQPQPAPDAWSILRQLMPLLILFVLPLLSSLFSGSSSPTGPSYRYDTAKPPHTMGRTTPKLNINYFVNPLDVEDLSPRKLRQLDQRVEVDYVSALRYECDGEVNLRDRRIQEAQGWFFPDVDKMKEARAMELKSCRKLESLRGKF
ncbi:Chaperone protein dnaJ [Penicillium longicatenatum]|nr:Chaperone protein dnaJ [Penicillium longicatenatum]